MLIPPCEIKFPIPNSPQLCGGKYDFDTVPLLYIQFIVVITHFMKNKCL